MNGVSSDSSAKLDTDDKLGFHKKTSPKYWDNYWGGESLIMMIAKFKTDSDRFSQQVQRV